MDYEFTPPKRKATNPWITLLIFAILFYIVMYIGLQLPSR